MFSPLNRHFQHNRQFPWQTYEEETIIIDPFQQNSFELTGVGSFVWQRMDGQHSLQEICDQLCTHYEVEHDEALRDLLDLVAELTAENLVIEKAQ